MRIILKEIEEVINDHNRRGHKWDNFTKNIWYNRKKYEGTGVIVIPSDPNALLERLDLLLASQEAGHTGVRYDRQPFNENFYEQRR